MICAISGQWVSRDEGSPTLADIAQGLSFTCRFHGQSRRFYSNILHVQVVADLMPPGEELFGLLHDAEEVCTGDFNGSLKTPEIREIGDRIRQRVLWERFGIEKLPDGVEAQIGHADARATAAEARALCHPKLLERFLASVPVPVEDKQADERVEHYLNKYQIPDLVTPTGAAIRDFKERVEAAWRAYKARTTNV